MKDTHRAILNSALLEAQRQVDAALDYHNPHALPIALRAIATAEQRLGADASMSAVIDAAFHGRLRGTVRRVLKSRGVSLT